MLRYKSSLLRDFTILSVLLVLVLLVAFAYRIILIETRVIEQRAENISGQLEHQFIETVDYTANILGYMARQISQHDDPTDLQYIYELFKSFGKDPRIRDTLSWTIIGWTNDKHVATVDGVLAIMEEPIDLSSRDYLPHTVAEPWRLHLGQPVTGSTSGKMIIPAGVGVVDKDGRYMGALVIGFELEKLHEQFVGIIGNQEVNFGLINKVNKMAIRSSEDTTIPSDLVERTEFFSDEKAVFAGSSLFQPAYYAIKFKNYPYLLYVELGYKEVWQEFLATLKDSLLELIIAASILGGIIIFFRKRVIWPIAKLSDAAIRLSRGERYIELPHATSKEINNLEHHILSVKRSMMRESRSKETLQKTQEKLKDALQVIKESDKEKELFLCDLHQALDMPIQAIINGTNILRKEELGALNYEDYSMIFDAMNDAGRQLETLTTEFLNPTEADVPEVIGKCITIQRRYATENGITIQTNIAQNIPLIWADKLRLRQILLSTLHHALLYVPSNESQQVFVDAKVEKIKSESGSDESWLEIVMTNDGFGFDEKIRIKHWDNHASTSGVFMSRDPNMINLDIETLRHLVGLHHGTFEIIVDGPTGNRFIIRLPYLEKEDLEKHPATRTKYIEKARKYCEKITEAVRKSGNVIEFPERKKDIPDS